MKSIIFNSSVVKELQDRFEKFIGGEDSSLPTNLQSLAYSVVLRNSKNIESDFEAILNICKTAKSEEQRLAAWGSIGAVNSLEMVRRILNEIVFDSSLIKAQDVMYPLSSLANDSPILLEARQELWDWFRYNWDKLCVLYAPTASLLARIMQCCTCLIGDDFITEMENWSNGFGLDKTEQEKRVESLKGINNVFKQTLEKVKGRTGWVKRFVEEKKV